MKILLIGGKKEYGLCKSYYRAFIELGNNVDIFDIRDKYEKSILVNKATHRLFWKFLASTFQDDLINKIHNFRPNLIIIFKGWIIKPSTLKKIKDKYPEIKIFNFNPDDPFNTWHHGNSNIWIRKSIPLYDIYFIWGKFLIPKLKNTGAKRVEYLPFGYDPELYYSVKVSEAEKKHYGSDVSFIGSWDEEREEWLSYLLDYDLKIWGNAWGKASREIQEKWMRKEMVGEDFSKVVNSSKINLNFIRKQNGSAHNMRTFEIPACRGFMLSIRTQEQNKFFEEGKESEYFISIKELRQKIDYYLEHPEKRKEIAEAGYKRIQEDDMNYKARAKKILETYQKIK